MPKFFFDQSDIKDGVVTLDGENAKHLIKVLRVKEEDGLILCDGNSFDYDVTVKEVFKDSLDVYIVKKYDNLAEPEIKITLFQGLAKGDKFSYIVEKAVEAGVNEIVPVAMKRCVVKAEPKEFLKKADRLQKISEAAAKQSNRGCIPHVSGLCTIKDVLKRSNEFDLLVLPYECEREQSLKSILRAHKTTKKIGVIIGPEGGFDEQEVALLETGGFHRSTLGTRILRTETAGIAAIFQIIYEFEN